MRPLFLAFPFIISLFFPVLGIAASFDPCANTSPDARSTVPGEFYGRRCDQMERFEELQLKKKERIDARNARIKQHTLELFKRKYGQENASRASIQKRVKSLQDENRLQILKENKGKQLEIRSSKRSVIQEKIQENRPKDTEESPTGLTKEALKTCAEFQGVRRLVCLRKEARGTR